MMRYLHHEFYGTGQFDLDLFPIAAGLAFFFEVDTEKHAVVVVAVHDFEDAGIDAMHSATEFAALDTTGAEPFEEAGLLAVDDGTEKVGRFEDSGQTRDFANWPQQRERRFEFERFPDAEKVAAEKQIEGLELVGVVIIAVPPAPIGTFGDIDRVPGARECFRGWRCLRFFALNQFFAGLREQVPGGVVLSMTDPDAEVVVDPGACE